MKDSSGGILATNIEGKVAEESLLLFLLSSRLLLTTGALSIVKLMEVLEVRTKVTTSVVVQFTCKKIRSSLECNSYSRLMPCTP